MTYITNEKRSEKAIFVAIFTPSFSSILQTFMIEEQSYRTIQFLDFTVS